jgi:hypothetical protein
VLSQISRVAFLSLARIYLVLSSWLELIFGTLQLHAHLSGSISRQCLHEVWVQKRERGETTLEDPLIVMPRGKFDYNLETWVHHLFMFLILPVP